MVVRFPTNYSYNGSKSMVGGNDGEADYEIHVDQQNCHYYAISTIILMPYWK